MKRILLITAGLALFGIAATSGIAQNRPAKSTPTSTVQSKSGAGVPETKIATVDTSVFVDEKAGIRRFFNATKALEREFEPIRTELTNLERRFKAPTAEYESTHLKSEHGRKSEKARADYQRRYSELTSPIVTDIDNALKLYASQHGLSMILDASKLPVLVVVPGVDITEAFIADFNSKNP